MSIEIKKSDIVLYVYFVCSMTQHTMHGALDAKSDFIGGVFDRWINIIPESIIFNKYFLPKACEQAEKDATVKVFSDFHKYDPKMVGIAPDVLGIKINNRIVPFVKYDDNKDKSKFWVAQENCTQIEVKSFKGKQYMVSLRDQNYGDKYLVMVEMDLDPDYLPPFFKNELFTEDITSQLQIPEDFVVSDSKGLLKQTEEVSFDREELGTLRLLTVLKASEFMNLALKLNKGDMPRYFVDVAERKIMVKESNFYPNRTMDEYCLTTKIGLSRLNEMWYEIFNIKNEVTLDIFIDKPENLLVIKKIKEAISVLAKDDVKVNNYMLEKGKQYNIKFATFGAIAGE